MSALPVGAGAGRAVRLGKPSTRLDRYRQLRREGDRSEKVAPDVPYTETEEQALDALDDLWYHLTPEERAMLDAETA